MLGSVTSNNRPAVLPASIAINVAEICVDLITSTFKGLSVGRPTSGSQIDPMRRLAMPPTRAYARRLPAARKQTGQTLSNTSTLNVSSGRTGIV